LKSWYTKDSFQIIRPTTTQEADFIKRKTEDFDKASVKSEADDFLKKRKLDQLSNSTISKKPAQSMKKRMKAYEESSSKSSSLSSDFSLKLTLYK